MRGDALGRRQHLVAVVSGFCSRCAGVQQSGPVRPLPSLPSMTRRRRCALVLPAPSFTAQQRMGRTRTRLICLLIAACRLWFNMGIVAFLVNMVLFSYLAFWLPYVLVRDHLSIRASSWVAFSMQCIIMICLSLPLISRYVVGDGKGRGKGIP